MAVFFPLLSTPIHRKTGSDRVMRIQKHVSLDIESAKKAEMLDNFSGYVRECLQGNLAFKHEAYLKRIDYLISVIRIARDMGSMHPTFKKAAADLWELNES